MTVDPNDIMASVRAFVSSLPPHFPSSLRVGVGVVEVLKAATPERPNGFHPTHLFGVPVIPDDTCAMGEWRVLDEHGNELHAGQIEAFRDIAPDVEVIRSRWLPPGTAGYSLPALNVLVLRDDTPTPTEETPTA